MESRTISVKFAKGSIGLDQRVAIVNRLREEANVKLVDWEEGREGTPLVIDVKETGIEKALVERVINMETDEGPACTWEE